MTTVDDVLAAMDAVELGTYFYMPIPRPTGYWYPMPARTILDPYIEATIPGVHTLSLTSRTALARAKMRGAMIAKRHVKRAAE